MQRRTEHTGAAGPERKFFPREVRSIEETGLSLGFLADLALKIMYISGYISGYEIAKAMGLPFANVVDQALDFLKREHLCEVRGSGGFGESAYQYVITSKGSDRAREVMERSQYIGPAPVPLQAYSVAMQRQSLRGMTFGPEYIRRALSHLVINDHVFGQIGPAVNSMRSIFLHGPPGNGKTAVAEAIGRMLPGTIYIPHAIDADGQIIKVFDSANHRPVEKDQEDIEASESNTLVSLDHPDGRWVRIERPVIMVGGELTLESLDLVYDEISKTHEAPFQMKANGGMFLIDDFGRQQVRPSELLNRWILPLEKGVDYLTLQSGKKIEVPFNLLIVFSTNLAPQDLVDEAFLRRIRYKIELPDPTFDEYREIFRRVCQSKGIQYDERVLAYLLHEYYIKPKVKLRAVHPRDIIEELVDIARFRGVKPALTKELVDEACKAYFLRD